MSNVRSQTDAAQAAAISARPAAQSNASSNAPTNAVQLSLWTLTQTVQAAVLGLLCLAVFLTLIFQLSSATYRWTLDYGEAPLIDQATRLLQGANIYRASIAQPPYTISNYPPLYIAALAPFVALFGPSFAPGRVISSVCAWLAALFIGLLLHRLTRNKTASFIGALSFLAVPYVVRCAYCARIDMLALALSMAGLYLLIDPELTQKRLVAGSLLLVAAIFTRQTYALAAPFAALVWLWVNAGWRRALTMGLIVAVLSAALFGGLTLITGGGFFYNIVSANVNEWAFDRLMWNWESFWKIMPVLFCVGVFSLVLFRKRMNVWSFTAPYLIGGMASAVTIGKIGSNVNYLLEFLAALCLGLGVVIAWAQSQRRTAAMLFTLAVMALCVPQVLSMVKSTLDDETVSLRDRIGQTKDLIWLENQILQSDGNVLADEHMDMMTLSRKPLLIQPFEVTVLSKAGLWDQNPLLDDIRHTKYSFILIHDFPGFEVYKERWTPEMLRAIQHAYALKQKLGSTWVYVPRQSLPAPKVVVTPEICPGAPWRIPSDATYGVRWSDDGSLLFLGRGNQGKIPVRAVANGELTRLKGWTHMVAIRHDDPLNPGQKIWTIYRDMASGSGGDSFVAPEFPEGVENAPVKAGQIIGYQGQYNGKALAIWVNVSLGIADEQTFAALAAGQMDVPYLTPLPYLNLDIKLPAQTTNPQSLKCGK